MTTRAFVGTNPTGELIASGLLVMDWNTTERLRGIRFYKERWPVRTGRVMLSATKEPHVGLWLLAGPRVLQPLSLT